MDDWEAYEKAIKYYRRWTLQLIPVTMIIPGLVKRRSLKYLNDDLRGKSAR